MHRRLILTSFAWLLASSIGFAHVGAINLFVNPTTDQIYALDVFEPPQLQMFLGIEISTDGPGLGVNFPANGMAAGADLAVDIGQDLHYWDGFGMASTTAGFEWNAPQFDSQGVAINSPVSDYLVTAETGKLNGMTWGNYNGGNFWEAHGLNFLWPLAADPGIYGVVLEVKSSFHVDSEPFVVPFVYDPNNVWDPVAEAAGAARVRAATAAHDIADLNQDGHVGLSDVDLLVADIAAGLNTPIYDLSDDGVVDSKDLLEWRKQAGTAKLPLPGAFLPGDANLDGFVDVTDLNIWNGNKFTSAAAWSDGDFNADGQVDVSDFNVWNQNKFSAAGGLGDAAPAQSVPEPAGWLASLFALIFFGRRCLVKPAEEQV